METEVEELERVWTHSGHAQAMNASEWRFHGIRPENSPTRRIVAASHLLARHRGSLLQSVLPALNRLPLTDVQENLEQSLRVQVGGYWASHFDFGAASGWRPALIGRSRARDIIVNVLLPFCSRLGIRVSSGMASRCVPQPLRGPSRDGRELDHPAHEGEGAR